MDSDTTARARRLGSVAALAKPVQHEINNLMTVILANLDLLRRHAAEGAPSRQLDRVGEAARRFEASTRSLLSLARRPVPDPAPFDPVATVKAMQPLLGLLVAMPGSLSVQEPAEASATVAGDRALFEDAVLACAAALSAEHRLEIGFDRTAEAVTVRFNFGCAAPAAALAALAPLGLEPPAADCLVRVRLARDPA